MVKKTLTQKNKELRAELKKQKDNNKEYVEGYNNIIDENRSLVKKCNNALGRSRGIPELEKTINSMSLELEGLISKVNVYEDILKTSKIIGGICEKDKHAIENGFNVNKTRRRY